MNKKHVKKVLITGGPTNEYIDEVMKITNMSSGKIAIELAKLFVDNGYNTTLMLTKNIKNPILDGLETKDNFCLERFETTDELYDLLIVASVTTPFDIIIHSSAVADYKPEFSFRLEDMAKELTEAMIGCSGMESDQIEKIFLNIMKNPCCKINDSTKISSIEPNLTVKLGLTPKIIANLREWFPDAYICGFKLLENVSEAELIDAAMKQLDKCKTNIVFANDLAELRKGNIARLVVTPNGYNNIKVDGAEGIFHLVDIIAKNP
jgi:phosphopantothenate-cysteine ligase